MKCHRVLYLNLLLRLQVRLKMLKIKIGKSVSRGHELEIEPQSVSPGGVLGWFRNLKISLPSISIFSRMKAAASNGWRSLTTSYRNYKSSAAVAKHKFTLPDTLKGQLAAAHECIEKMSISGEKVDMIINLLSNPLLSKSDREKLLEKMGDKDLGSIIDSAAQAKYENVKKGLIRGYIPIAMSSEVLQGHIRTLVQSRTPQNANQIENTLKLLRLFRPEVAKSLEKEVLDGLQNEEGVLIDNKEQIIDAIKSPLVSPQIKAKLVSAVIEQGKAEDVNLKTLLMSECVPYSEFHEALVQEAQTRILRKEEQPELEHKVEFDLKMLEGPQSEISSEISSWGDLLPPTVWYDLCKNDNVLSKIIFSGVPVKLPPLQQRSRPTFEEVTQVAVNKSVLSQNFVILNLAITEGEYPAGYDKTDYINLVKSNIQNIGNELLSLKEQLKKCDVDDFNELEKLQNRYSAALSNFYRVLEGCKLGGDEIHNHAAEILSDPKIEKMLKQLSKNHSDLINNMFLSQKAAGLFDTDMFKKLQLETQDLAKIPWVAKLVSEYEAVMSISIDLVQKNPTINSSELPKKEFSSFERQILKATYFYLSRDIVDETLKNRYKPYQFPLAKTSAEFQNCAKNASSEILGIKVGSTVQEQPLAEGSTAADEKILAEALETGNLPASGFSSKGIAVLLFNKLTTSSKDDQVKLKALMNNISKDHPVFKELQNITTDWLLRKSGPQQEIDQRKGQLQFEFDRKRMLMLKNLATNSPDLWNWIKHEGMEKDLFPDRDPWTSLVLSNNMLLENDGLEPSDALSPRAELALMQKVDEDLSYQTPEKQVALRSEVYVRYREITSNFMKQKQSTFNETVNTQEREGKASLAERLSDTVTESSIVIILDKMPLNINGNLFENLRKDKNSNSYQVNIQAQIERNKAAFEKNKAETFDMVTKRLHIG